MTGEENRKEDSELVELFSFGAGVQGRAALRTCKGDIVWVHAALAMALIALSRNPMEYGFLPGPDIVPESGACFGDWTPSTVTLTRCQAGSKKR